ncbi:hypothetical protein T11_14934 [Trichinella zimbabwensis]|uniref:Uncharacterized protein n=1 Tax=Trichinella zimbabwensis TaxID=268475 RepID=A0A0V1GSC9_9BILA|nr:hypothetical protein T11_14934 [Trichinella zimbabwensis]
MSEMQTLYPWLISHFDGVRLSVAVRNCSAGGKDCIQAQ